MTLRADGKQSKMVTLGKLTMRTILTTDDSGVMAPFVFLSKIKPIHRFFNDKLIDMVVTSTSSRPLPSSPWGPKTKPDAPASTASPDSATYVSWSGLVDRTYTGRHLPECTKAYSDSLPALDRLQPLFERGPQMIACPRSSVLLCFFAQWFTDSFLRTDPNDFKKNTSNHEIDLCQIYGLSEEDTQLLRAHEGGRLKSEMCEHGEFPMRLFGADGQSVDPQFMGLNYIDAATGTYANTSVMAQFNTPERRKELFASGLERGNSTIFYAAISTLFLREHNRLAAAIQAANPTFDDDRLFEHARNANIAQLLKIIVEDYINHLSSTPIPFFLDVGKAERKDWYRTNRISAEFDLLYRWHALTPSSVTLKGEELQPGDFLYNNDLLKKVGIETVLNEISRQPAGRIGLHNTAKFLIPVDLAGIEKSRKWKLRSYNDYREAFSLPRLRNMTQLTRDRHLTHELTQLYGNVNHVELIFGLLAEARGENAVLGELMRLMVGVDAFSQALTNPLLSENVFGEGAFTRTGLASVNATHSLDDVARRNLKMNGQHIGFNRS